MLPLRRVAILCGGSIASISIVFFIYCNNVFNNVERRAGTVGFLTGELMEDYGGRSSELRKDFFVRRRAGRYKNDLIEDSYGEDIYLSSDSLSEDTSSSSSQSSPRESRSSSSHSHSSSKYSRSSTRDSRSLPKHSRSSSRDSRSLPKHSRSSSRDSRSLPKHSRSSSRDSRSLPKHSRSSSRNSQSSPRDSLLKHEDAFYLSEEELVTIVQIEESQQEESS